jgi:hypothetical protein
MKNTSWVLMCLAVVIMGCNEKMCMPGYSGDNCDQEITPTKMFIKKIAINHFPPYDNGSLWDAFDGADIFPVVLSADSSITYWTASNYISNASPDVSNEFGLTSYMTISQPTSAYKLALFDYDSGLAGANDFMGSVTFMPYIKGNGFPTSIFVENGELQVQIYVRYEW